ncbi:cupin domain-containing protein [Rhizobium leguminosarum]|nr:cupin domain-containing protein [Rhizobium leguminosarum]MBY5673714.1 cupin domain-containing protein [Rhizobium leguminosarum]
MEMETMKKIVATALPLALMGVEPASAEGVAVSPNGSRAHAIGPAQNFTGHVLVEPLFAVDQNKRSIGGHVTFSPGARSAWHVHSTGQVLIVTDGVGWIQEDGGAKREIRAGDVVWTAAGVKHWHGATATASMRHISITFPDDPAVPGGWMEHVIDEQYLN